jgi:hypothetical protein
MDGNSCADRAAVAARALALCSGLLLASPAPAADDRAAPAAGAPTDFVYRAKQGDTLIALGKELLERPNDWQQVQKLNAIADPRRIPTGHLIRIPVRLLKGEPAVGRIEQAVGDARIAGTTGATAVAVHTGDTVAEGTRIETGEDGYVSIRLADGSLLRVQAGSVTVLEQSRRYPHANFFAAAWRLVAGRVEAVVIELTGGEPRFEVRTPQSTLGVRGTDFRVASDPARAQTRGEVLVGTVDVRAKAGAPTRLGAGFATIVDATGKAEPPIALLPAPDLAKLPALHERLLVRFDVPAVAGASAYRAQVARDRDFQSVVAESLTPTGALRFAGLPDQQWFMRVRAVDTRGIEGRDAVFEFRLKARPEPPIQSAPAPRTKLRARGVEFAWTRNPDATAYDFQLATDETFAAPVQQRRAIGDSTLALDGLAPGTYFWRLASLRSATDRGPWGDAATFTLGGLPEAPASAVDAANVRFSWAGEAGQTFEFQLARDRAFNDVVLTRELTEPELVMPKPAPGTYYVRYRARDADGFVGPFTSAQQLDLARCVLDGSGGCVGAVNGALPAQ